MNANGKLFLQKSTVLDVSQVLSSPLTTINYVSCEQQKSYVTVFWNGSSYYLAEILLVQSQQLSLNSNSKLSSNNNSKLSFVFTKSISSVVLNLVKMRNRTTVSRHNCYTNINFTFSQVFFSKHF